MAERPVKIIPLATARPRVPGPQTLGWGDWVSLPWEWRWEGGRRASCAPGLFLGDSFPGKFGDCLEESGRLCTFVIWGHSNSPQPETVETHLREHFLAHRCLFHGDWVEGFSARV